MNSNPSLPLSPDGDGNNRTSGVATNNSGTCTSTDFAALMAAATNNPEQLPGLLAALSQQPPPLTTTTTATTTAASAIVNSTTASSSFQPHQQQQLIPYMHASTPSTQDQGQAPQAQAQAPQPQMASSSFDNSNPTASFLQMMTMTNNTNHGGCGNHQNSFNVNTNSGHQVTQPNTGKMQPPMAASFPNQTSNQTWSNFGNQNFQPMNQNQSASTQNQAQVLAQPSTNRASLFPVAAAPQGQTLQAGASASDSTNQLMTQFLNQLTNSVPQQQQQPPLTPSQPQGNAGAPAASSDGLQGALAALMTMVAGSQSTSTGTVPINNQTDGQAQLQGLIQQLACGTTTASNTQASVQQRQQQPPSAERFQQLLMNATSQPGSQQAPSTSGNNANSGQGFNLSSWFAQPGPAALGSQPQQQQVMSSSFAQPASTTVAQTTSNINNGWAPAVNPSAANGTATPNQTTSDLLALLKNIINGGNTSTTTTTGVPGAAATASGTNNIFQQQVQQQQQQPVAPPIPGIVSFPQKKKPAATATASSSAPSHHGADGSGTPRLSTEARDVEAALKKQRIEQEQMEAMAALIRTQQEKSQVEMQIKLQREEIRLQAEAESEAIARSTLQMLHGSTIPLRKRKKQASKQNNAGTRKKKQKNEDKKSGNGLSTSNANSAGLMLLAEQVETQSQISSNTSMTSGEPTAGGNVVQTLSSETYNDSNNQAAVAQLLSVVKQGKLGERQTKPPQSTSTQDTEQLFSHNHVPRYVTVPQQGGTQSNYAVAEKKPSVEAALAARSTVMVPPRKRERGRPGVFPQKIHQMLTDLERLGMDDIVSFLPGKNVFAIHKNKEFINCVMPTYFNTNNFASFQRQLNMYGFKRITEEGPDYGAYFHELFIRNQPLLSTKIKRKQGPTRKPSRAGGTKRDDYDSKPAGSGRERHKGKKNAAREQEDNTKAGNKHGNLAKVAAYALPMETSLVPANVSDKCSSSGGSDSSKASDKQRKKKPAQLGVASV